MATRPLLRPARSGPAAHPRARRQRLGPGPGPEGLGGAAPVAASLPGPADGPEQPPSTGAVGAAAPLTRRPAPRAFLPRSSMYYDEDGDLAHEFYEETIVTKNGRKRAKLKRIHKNLIPQLLHGQCLAERLPPPAPGCTPDPAWAAAAAPRRLSRDEGKGQSASALHAVACGYPVPRRLQGLVPGGHGAFRGADTTRGDSRSFVCLQSARSVPLPTALPLLSGYSETGAPSHSCGFPRDHLRGVTAGCCCPRVGLPRVSPREAAPSSRRSGGRWDEGGRSDTQTWIVALPSPGGKAGRSGLCRAVLGCCSSQEMGDLVQRLLTNTPA
ncbi:tumor suppressor candidate 2 [Aix galericulata]|nr:tumor suppressor candidate 2 [Aix galericulata]